MGLEHTEHGAGWQNVRSVEIVRPGHTGPSRP